jgi:hypothetical protein
VLFYRLITPPQFAAIAGTECSVRVGRQTMWRGVDPIGVKN